VGNVSTGKDYYINSKKTDTTNDKDILSLTSSASSFDKLRILMISPEYPPINGGVGRYTYNLVQELRKQSVNVYVACDNRGNGDFVGLSPNNIHNSKIILHLVDKIKPDIVHIQYEPGLYGLKLHSYRPSKIHTTIDSIYTNSKVPIVTTFHSGYVFRQWMRIPELKINKKKESLLAPEKNVDDKNHKLLSSLRSTLDDISIYWKYLINYKAFQKQNMEKLLNSNTGIVFSEYMRTIIDAKKSNKVYDSKVRLLYHGAEPITSLKGINKKDARTRFPSLPQNNSHRIAIAFGFMTVAKGWDILRKMRIPDNWTIVISSSVNHTTGERIRLNNLGSIINLNQDYLSEKDLSALFYASDAVLLPYKITSGSGVMFDALGHGIPFIASDLPFFKEFASKGLGITAKRTPNAFTDALLELDRNYDKYKKAVEGFKKYLKWNIVARNHIELYNSITSSTRILTSNKTTIAIAKSVTDRTSAHVKGNYF
jgi:glycosyltransferase involved in cell wall biosynthesis